MTEAAESLAVDLELTQGFFDPDNPPQRPYVFSYVRAAFALSLDPLWPRYRVEVPDGNENRTFLVGKPQFCAKGLFGRATRGYVALDCETGLFVWLKDTWRACGVFAAREGDVLMELNMGHVGNVPTLLYHDDLPGQITYTPQRWAEQQGESESAEAGCAAGRKRTQGSGQSDRVRSCLLRRYQHYRLVVEEVALQLSEFQTGQQLVSILKDCVVAHRGAFEHLSLLHGDISGGNMLIYRRIDKVGGRYALRLRGILVDWEMARPASEMPSEKTGTLSFMSVARLSLTKPVEVCDELESFALMGSTRRCARTTASDASYDHDHTRRRPHSSCASLTTSCTCVVARIELGNTRTVENKPSASQCATRRPRRQPRAPTTSESRSRRLRRPTRRRSATRRCYGSAGDRRFTALYRARRGTACRLLPPVPLDF
ncbi:hypothetical protein L227DRAFT_513023 [Lentinus tigrinus ALCF2SS1-6]|uniref:Fungal-type protein kinase domain-containing protein n=2 Tax=Lentinus tigrinus TaxID=5365 RepID=A0A5C2RTN1_9APHY|nr:hypothetical protein L227DRAFT_513023 [Lentinus tigrinus ALCF2SS1-6]